MSRTPIHLLLAAALAAACGPTADGRLGEPRTSDGGGWAGDLARDPTRDYDRDDYTIAQGDCDDDRLDVNPGEMEVCGDRVDQDCDGQVDEDCDNDQDGTTLTNGDCDDNDNRIGPNAIEVVGNQLDDDCDGKADEVPEPCDVNLTDDPNDLAGSIELCKPWVIASVVNALSDPRARAARRDFGVYRPRGGRSLVLLSTGHAADANDPDFALPQPGTEFDNDAPNPLPMMNANGCYMGPDEATVHDYVEWTLTLKAPQNARSFSFDFMFVTAEYPEYVCSQYNDKFLAILDSQQFKGNVSFDSKGAPVTVNIGFFDVCESTMMNACGKPVSLLQGTGHERFDYMNRPIGGGTDWLRTISPVTPNETITLRFVLFDEGDRKFDSTVVLDNFQWQLEAAMGPTTIQ